MSTPEPDFTLSEAGEFLRLGERQLRRLEKAGHLNFYKLGHRTIVTRDSAVRWREEQKAHGFQPSRRFSSSSAKRAGPPKRK